MNLQELIDSDSVYWFCALVGSGMFLIQLLLNLIGLGGDESLNNDQGADAGNFKWMSRQALSGFLMMFGWMGLTCQKEFGIEGPLKIVIALSAGVVALYATAAILNFTKKLHSRGTVFNIDAAIGLEAFVYQRIPSAGVGKISVCVENFTRELDAMSLAHVELPSFTKVKIIQKADNTTVFVVAS